jgi:hypothetical protein
LASERLITCTRTTRTSSEPRNFYWRRDTPTPDFMRFLGIVVFQQSERDRLRHENSGSGKNPHKHAALMEIQCEPNGGAVLEDAAVMVAFTCLSVDSRDVYIRRRCDVNSYLRKRPYLACPSILVMYIRRRCDASPKDYALTIVPIVLHVLSSTHNTLH